MRQVGYSLCTNMRPDPQQVMTCGASTTNVRVELAARPPDPRRKPASPYPLRQRRAGLSEATRLKQDLPDPQAQVAPQTPNVRRANTSRPRAVRSTRAGRRGMRPASASGGREPVRGHMALPQSAAFYAEGSAVSFPQMGKFWAHAPLWPSSGGGGPLPHVHGMVSCALTRLGKWPCTPPGGPLAGFFGACVLFVPQRENSPPEGSGAASWPRKRVDEWRCE